MNTLGWWCLSGPSLLEALRRAHGGEDPDLVFTEMYANSDIETEPNRPADSVPALARAIGPVLKQLYPQNPDIVLGREARAIAEAIAPVVTQLDDEA